ncbi:MAG: hypothetical protein HQ593_04115 [Candidatus Omnitrophica bacterium]|nr:hypothetical protein [Candidatus Omnitrophota bacterium]
MQKPYIYIVISIITISLVMGLPSATLAAEVEGIEEVPEALSTEALKLKAETSQAKIIPLIDITALGLYSKVIGSGGLEGVDVKGTFAPVVKYDDKHYFIPMYYGAYKKSRQVVTQEEGGQIYNTITNQNLTLQYKYIPSKRWILRANGLARLHYVEESGDSFGDGLYDYRDFGLGGNVERVLSKTSTSQRSLTTGIEYYQRDYPNYQSLISLATVTAPETDEKNYSGIRPSLRYKSATRERVINIMYSPLYKDYADKKIIGSDGVLTSDTREDWFHYLKINYLRMPVEGSIMYGLGLTGIINDSNQHYYDSRSTVSLTDDIFSKNYYSFASLSVNPSVTYVSRVPDKGVATLKLGYNYLVRLYNDRKAQQTNGTYTLSEQLDKIHTVQIEGIYPVNKQWSSMLLYNHTFAHSNMKYETYYQYEYESYFLALGLKYKY